MEEHKITATHRIFALMPVSKSVALTCSTLVPAERVPGREREMIALIKIRKLYWMLSTNFHRFYWPEICPWGGLISIVIIDTANKNSPLIFIRLN